MKWLIATVCISILAGCGTLGNGKLDIPHVDIGFVAPDGTPYSFVYDENGLKVEGKYRSPKTGLIYEISHSGGFVVTDPRTGLNVRLKQVGDSNE